MGDAGRADDRLPWLETPRTAKPTKRRPAARRARTPLLLLLGLFMAGVIAVMAFITGRSTAPRRVPAAAINVPLPPPVPAPETVVVPPAPVAIMPEPAAIVPSAAPAKPRVVRPAAVKAPARRSVERSRGVTIHRNRATPPPTPPRYRWPTPSASGPSGRVVQLGAYYNGRQTMAAWRRLRLAYPYLATLPRKVTIVRPGAGRPRYYRLRIGAESEAHARAICDSLHRIGRGCTVV